LLQPQWYIEHGGIWLILFIVFAETGLFMGFFFPGDSLLFVAGIEWESISRNFFGLSFLPIMTIVSFCAIAGNAVGYWTGRKVGPAMYRWKDGWFFKQRYLRQAKEFYDKYGGGAIFMARFVPFVRTFAPIVAGIVQMEKKKFTFYSVVSAFAWVFSMMLGGRYLRELLISKFNYDLKADIEWIVLGIVLISTLPIIIKLITGRNKKNEPPPVQESNT
jgi:membrane-associated protein